MWSGGVGGWFSQKIIPLRGPILQAEACQRFSAELRFQDRAEFGNIMAFKRQQNINFIIFNILTLKMTFLLRFVE